ncbi:hypothetical protein ACFV7Q_15495 [Streptomyces sp. NPDC059851]|uniref:hypothetical protein n=1 Tax=Streptomyces sp. NPDC059851 TaxID=3346971 RepID=UPI00365E5C0A
MTGGSPDPEQRAAARREVLLARLREHNQRSAAGPAATWRSAQRLEVTADGVRRGDLIAVGGTPHRVADVREPRRGRMRLEFENGSVYVLQPWAYLTVVREQGGGEPVRRGRT